MSSLPPPQEPLAFVRIPKAKVWGGERLAERLGVRTADGPLGETWELSDYPGEETAIRGGAWDGRTLRELMDEHGAAVLGASRPSADGRFPLLVKFIDAGDDLSVQIHPPDGPKSPTGVGKTEAWYVLDGAPDASLICGLKPGTTREAFEAAAGGPGVREFLHELSVRRGDCVLVPAGQTHAIRRGTVLCEVQQTSDVTYRMYDWDRVGLDGKPRETHLEQALEVVDWSLPPAEPVRAEFVGGPGLQSEPLVACPYFELRALRAGEQGGEVRTEGRASVLSVVGGAGRIEPLPGSTFAPRDLRFGDVLLLPATLEGVTLRALGAAGLEVLQAVAL